MNDKGQLVSTDNFLSDNDMIIENKFFYHIKIYKLFVFDNRLRIIGHRAKITIKNQGKGNSMKIISLH